MRQEHDVDDHRREAGAGAPAVSPRLHVCGTRVIRVRARGVPELVGQEDLAARVTAELAAARGVRRARARAVTATVAVWFEAEVITLERVLAALREAGLTSLHPSLPRDRSGRRPLDGLADLVVRKAAARAIDAALGPAALPAATLALAFLEGKPEIHATDRRLRLTVPSLRASPERARIAEATAMCLPGAVDARVNVATGDLVVHHAAGSLSPRALASALRAEGLLAEELAEDLSRRRFTLAPFGKRALALGVPALFSRLLR